MSGSNQPRLNRQFAFPNISKLFRRRVIRNYLAKQLNHLPNDLYLAACFRADLYPWKGSCGATIACPGKSCYSRCDRWFYPKQHHASHLIY
jgi:hypothetical protein